MMISIAMTTYNGAKYLKEQLDSFAYQSRLPDELVVCDDLSSDDSIDILERFRNAAPFDVKIFCNENKLGPTKNFEKALSLCGGELVLFSDQDDVWFDKKIKVIEDFFGDNPNIMISLNDRELVDDSLKSSGLTNFSNAHALGLDDSWPCAGCCTAIRSVFRNVLIPFPGELVDYDAWIHRLGRAFGVRKVINETLQYYRRHGANASDAVTSSLKKPNILTLLKRYGLADATAGWLKEIEISEHLQKFIATKFCDLEKLMLSNRILSIVEFEQKRNGALKRRIELMEHRNFRRCFGVFVLYMKGDYNFFSGWKSVVKDIVR